MAIERYLADSKCHFWYYYNDKNDEDFYEVSYVAQKNDKGVKPRFAGIWHPDERIGISKIETGVKMFAKTHLGINNCDIEIQNDEPFEDSLNSFKEHEETFRCQSKVEVTFTDKLIEELSQLWKKTKEEVIKKLNNSIQ